MKHSFNKLALAVTICAGSATAMAQSAGTWMIKGGVNHVAPDVSSSDLSPPSLPGTKIDVKSATSAIFSATFMVTDAMSVEFYAPAPSEHDVVAAGAIAGAGKIGTVKQVLPTLFAQYRFMPASAAFRPYVGLGLTYAYFFGEEGSGVLTALTNPGGQPTRLSASSAFGLSPQVGFSVKLNERWYLDGSVIKTFVKNNFTLSTGQKIDTELDPVSANLSVGYRF